MALAIAVIIPLLAFLWVLLNWLFGGFDVSCIDNGREDKEKDKGGDA